MTFFSKAIAEHLLILATASASHFHLAHEVVVGRAESHVGAERSGSIHAAGVQLLNEVEARHGIGVEHAGSVGHVVVASHSAESALLLLEEAAIRRVHEVAVARISVGVGETIVRLRTAYAIAERAGQLTNLAEARAVGHCQAAQKLKVLILD